MRDATHIRVDDRATGVVALAPLPVEPCLISINDRAASLNTATVITQSEASFRRYGTGSVAEATALLAAGKGARLIAPRVVSSDGMATCAIAEGKGE